jgi:hypothetical protein
LSESAALLKGPSGWHRFGRGPGVGEEAARVEDPNCLAPPHAFALMHPLDDIARLAAAETVPHVVVEVQP